ncbi:unnamed protein product [Darwinula stevensoni]|uniref:H15 domain-containing protein n=1 Tax=Darwinula stevensoni TaxID=69355 RepID=A0A7R8XBN2_9CRUS|nr:unnamed protein product [Darwinula stevensoni]CAG0884995.1 unnamed protein product [Darwinula stevensoni]
MAWADREQSRRKGIEEAQEKPAEGAGRRAAWTVPRLFPVSFVQDIHSFVSIAMADAAVAPTPAAASPAKKGGKAKAAAKPKKAPVHNHPPYGDMIVASIAALKERGGSSRVAILKYIMQHYDVGADSKVVNSRVKLALKKAETSGKIKHAKGGVGASGSFKLADKAEKPKKKVVKKPKSPKKPAGEKKAKTAKPKAQKSTKPKASKPKKSPKKPKSPKKAGAAKPKATKPKAAAKPKAAKPKPKPKATKAKASPKK